METLTSPLNSVPGRLRRLSRRAWRRTRSRSVLELLLFGFILVGAPLIVGLVIAGQQIRLVTGQSEQLFQRTTELNQGAHEMARQLVAVERAARQYRVLNDEEAEASLSRQRQAFHRRTHALLGMELERDLHGQLEQLVARESLLAEQVLTDQASVEWPAPLAMGYRELEALSRAITDEIDAAADRDLERLAGMGQRARTTWLVQLTLIVPFAIGLALVFTGLINRPIRRLDQGIRALAHPEAGPIEPVGMPRDLRALSVRLEWARRRLRRIERDRQRLLGQVSHELKTPLSAIREGASLLDEQLFGPLNDRQAEVLDILRSNAERLQEQIDSLLRYNQLRSGMEPALDQAVVVAELVDDVLAAHALELTARGQSVERQVDPTVTVCGNYDMLRTALDNLVSNAIKYTQGDALIRIDAGVKEPWVIIEVADRGPGIAVPDRYRLFEPFFRGQSASQGSIPGSGLGLSICRDLVAVHRGTVDLITRPGWTTTFRIRLPARPAKEKQDEN